MSASNARTAAERLAAAAANSDPVRQVLAEETALALEDPDLDNLITGLGGADIFDGLGGDDTIFGLRGKDLLTGGEGDDALFGGGDADTLNGGEGIDRLEGGRGGDTLRGDNGDDLLEGGRGGDTLEGGAGADELLGSFGDDVLNGGAGIDILRGGHGNDTYIVDVAGDVLQEGRLGGRDTVESAVTWTLGVNFENLELTGATAIDGTGTDGANTLTGNTGANKLWGEAGNDVLDGGAGADTLTGGLGHDTLTGGAGADTFVFLQESVGQRERDRITDFKAGDGDLINLSAIDADTTLDGDQAFTAVAELSGVAGEMSLEYRAGKTILRLDVDGDGKADLTVKINGDVTMNSGDWLL